MILKVVPLVISIVLASSVGACGGDDVVASGSRGRTALELADDSPHSVASVAPFHFISCEGQPITEADLQGKVWIVDFFFTTCSGPCPLITSQMRLLQDELVGSNVQLVSITVDPTTDTPAALHDYAERVGADLKRWWFLNGDEAATFELIRNSFALMVERQSEAMLGFQVSHATKLVVVDGVGRVRGYYAGETPEGRAMARTRALWLSKHAGS